MQASLSKLQSPGAVQAALDEFRSLGRAVFLEKYGFGRSRDFLVVDPKSGGMADSKAIVGVAYGYAVPDAGPLRASDFSGGEATVVPKLRALGFTVVRIGEDWSEEEVDATVEAYFRMLALEAQASAYRKTDFNAELRQRLRGRSKASVELKFQNVSAVLHALNLPFVPGYKPRGNTQLLLRKAVQRFLLENAAWVATIADAMEDARPVNARPFQAVLVEQPQVENVVVPDLGRVRLPRKIDFAGRDQANRKLGRAGEQWVLEYEQARLNQVGRPDLFARVDWVSDRLGDGAGFDIQSYEETNAPRYIEVKTTNAGHASAFIVSRNELEFSKEAGEQFVLYRLFEFRRSPRLYMLRGDVSQHVALEPLDYRAAFRRVQAA
ncbi:hypothetical protein CKO44_09315 [Rubrivivax gelatinosus]|uniref:Protein NO VEIN C-terminal domain-containing protein n=1 Tax=Rubrivivax gelatinosus TaxID=28068 RepID=A0ABS1DQA9_RUBGE|nr:hypothetical protein [Rubrivivax gelatinosus]MBK1712182.1 hypothetical protein [Rubrivivax gelatinosus]